MKKLFTSLFVVAFYCTTLAQETLQTVTNNGNTTTNTIQAFGFFLDGAASAYKELQYKTNGLLRWDMFTFDVENGSNTGSNLYLNAYADNQSGIGNIWQINRNNRVMTFAVRPTLNGAGLVANDGDTYTLNINGSADKWAGYGFDWSANNTDNEYILGWNGNIGKWQPASKSAMKTSLMPTLQEVTGKGATTTDRLTLGSFDVYDNELNNTSNARLYIGYRNTSNTIIQANGGNVGVGEYNPVSLVHLNGTSPILTLTASQYNGDYKTTLGLRPGAQAFLILGNNAQNEIRAGRTGTGGYLDFFTNNTAGQETASDGNLAMRLAVNGNVGIGTTTTNEKLSVNGKIRAKEIKVEATGWPDYVFEDGYQTRSVTELEQFIKQYKRLPEVPSAKEVEQNGVALGEMNKILLKKIEELTLLLIEQNKKNEQQDELIKKLTSKIERIK